MATTNTTGSTKSAARKQSKTTAKGQATKTKNQTKRTATTAKSSAKRTTTEAKKTVAPAKGGVVAASEYVKQAAETAVDVPVGAALTAVDRVSEVGDRFNTPHKREVEIRRVRNQLRRELNKVERRGGTARRKVVQRAKRNRTEAEKRVREVGDRVQSLV